MKKTLITYGIVLLGAGAMVVAATNVQAAQSGVGNDRTGMTVDNAGMMTSSGTNYIKPNDDIVPVANSMSSAPSTNGVNH